jgi:hypothetical protein
MLVLAVSLGIPIVTYGAPVQDLDRINDIVNQARGLAQSARTDFSNPQTDGVHRGLNNPFSRGASTNNIGVRGANGTDVEIDGNQIRVNAAGRAFVFPRINSPSHPGVGNPGFAGSPIGNRSVDQTLATVAGYRSLAEAVQRFRNSDFEGAAAQMRDATTVNLQQPALAPFHSLCLFATRDYIRSAEFAYAAAAESQIWGWEQVKGYYGNPEYHSQQYRDLQNAANDPDADVSVQFLLGYHHLMLGHRNHARQQFERVLTKLPNDPVTRHLLTIANQGPPLPMN